MDAALAESGTVTGVLLRTISRIVRAAFGEKEESGTGEKVQSPSRNAAPPRAAGFKRTPLRSLSERWQPKQKRCPPAPQSLAVPRGVQQFRPPFRRQFAERSEQPRRVYGQSLIRSWSHWHPLTAETYFSGCVPNFFLYCYGILHCVPMHATSARCMRDSSRPRLRCGRQCSTSPGSRRVSYGRNVIARPRCELAAAKIWDDAMADVIAQNKWQPFGMLENVSRKRCGKSEAN